MFYAKPAYLDQEPISGVDAPELPGQYTATSGDVLSTGFDSGVRSSQTFSRTINESSIYDEHNKLVKDLTGQDLPNPAYEDYSTKDISRFYKDYDDARRQGMDWSFGDFKRHWNDQEYRKELALIGTKHPEHQSTILPEKSFISQAYERARQAEQSFANAQERMRPGIGRTLSGLAGEMAGVMLDPVNIATTPLGFAGVGTGWRGLAMGFVKSGGLNAGTEALTAPFVQQYRAEAGLDYGLDQAAFGVASAFVMGGLLDLGIRGAARGVRAWGDFAPVVENGIVVGYRRRERGAQIPPELAERAKAGDVDAQAEVAKLTRTDDLIKPETIQRAEALDPAAIREIAEKSGLADENPVVRQTLDTMDANERLNEKPSPLVSDFDHAANVTQAIRHAASPDLEPAPVRVDETPPIPQATAEQIDALTKQVAELKGDVVGLARLIKNQPETVSEALPVADGDLRLARNLASLEETAFSRVTQGEVNPELAGMVAEFVADPAQHGRMLDDLIRAKPSTPTEARQRIAEFLRSPDYAPQVADTGTAPGLKTKALDDPYGSDAKTQVAALEQQMAEELGRKAEAEVRASTPPDPVEVRAAQEQAISLADQIKAIVREVVGVDSADLGVTVRTFSAASDIQSEGLRLQVEQANIAAYGVALDRFTSATSEVERMAARAMMDEARAGRGVQGFADGTDIYLASYAANPKAYVAHELVHALRRLGKLTGEEIASLAMRARRIGAFDKALEDAYRKVLEGQGKTGKALNDLLDEEAAARLIERYFKGQAIDLPKVQATILDRLAELFATLRTKLRQAMGMREADVPPQDMANKIIEAFTSGEIARRQVDAENAAQVRQAMAAEDITALAVKPEAARVTELAQSSSPNLMFAFAGERAKTADLDALNRAKQMADDGVDRTRIWTDTGWFRGVDGKWRFEIDDSQARLLRSTADMQEGVSSPLGDIYRHPELFGAYPGMARTKFAPTQAYRPGEGAMVRMPDGQNALVAGYRPDRVTQSDMGIVNLLPHETQHLAQDFEGFASGGTQEANAARMNSHAAWRARMPSALRTMMDERGLGKVYSGDPEAVQMKDELRQRIEDDSGQPFRYRVLSGMDGMDEFDMALELARSRSPEQLRDIAMNGLRQTGADSYNRLAGEVEARTVQKRMDLTADERRARPPWEDYDVPEKDQIVRFAGGEQQAMFAIADSDTGRSMRRALDDLGYYSKLDEVLAGFGPKDRVTAATLQQRGVKMAEIEARGLKSALDAGPVPVSDLIATAQANPVEVKEAQYKNMGLDERKARIDELERRRDAINTSLSPRELGGGIRNPIGAINDWRYGRIDGQIRDIEREIADLERASVKWQAHSLDPSNPSYRETVIHLPATPMYEVAEINGAYRLIDEQGFPVGDPFINRQSAQEAADMGRFAPDFRSGHFSEPNIIGHMMTSMVKHEGKPVYLIDQIQSDWGQKLRDGGVRDEAKIAELKKQLDSAQAEMKALRPKAIIDAKKIDQSGIDRELRMNWDAENDGVLSMGIKDWMDEGVELGADAKRFVDLGDQVRLLAAEYATANTNTTSGHPLVNTTDQWTTTTLRRAIRQAAEADADYIAIPTGDTVLSYNPGDENGMRQFYGSVNTPEHIVGIVPKNLRKILEKIDPASAKPTYSAKVETPTYGMKGEGFTLFPLTDTVKAKVKNDGQAMFALRDEPVTPGLDMIPEARKQRAEAMGFDTGTVYYHTSQNQIDAFDLSRGGGALGPSFGKGEPFFRGKHVEPYYLRLKNRLSFNTGFEVTPRELVRFLVDGTYQDFNGDVRPVGVDISPADKAVLAATVAETGWSADRAEIVRDVMRRYGVDGFEFVHEMATETIPFDPTNIRSVNAAFDPARADSPNLMFALGDDRAATPDTDPIARLTSRLSALSGDAGSNIPGLSERVQAALDGLALVQQAAAEQADGAPDLVGLARAGAERGLMQAIETLGPERALQLAGHIQTALKDVPADPRALAEAINGVLDAYMPEDPVMFALRDEKGRPKAGAAARAQQLQMDFAEIEAEFQRKMAAPGVDLEAKLKAEQDKFQAQRAALINAAAQEKLLDDVTKFTTPVGQSDKGQGLMRTVQTDGRTGGAMDVASLDLNILRELQAPIDKTLMEFRKGAILGDRRRTWNKGLVTKMERIVDAIYDVKVDDPTAVAAAKGISESLELGRQKFNAEGGAIGKLEKYRLPQAHDGGTWAKMGRDRVVDDFAGTDTKEGWVDIFDRDGKPLSKTELRKVMVDIYQNNVSDSWNKADIDNMGMSAMGSGALYKHHREHRVMHFKSADAYKAYVNTYYNGDFLGLLVMHLRMMSREIAAMRRFGANPDLVISRVKAQLMQEAKMTGWAKSIYDDLKDDVAELKTRLRAMPSETQPIMDEIGRIHTELDKLRAEDKGRIVKRNAEAIAKLDNDLFDQHQKFRSAFGATAMPEDAGKLFAKISAKMDEMATLEAYPVTSKNPEERLRYYFKRFDDMYASYTGKSNVPVSSMMAEVMAASRNWVSSTVLQAASISSLTDFNNQILARQFIGMPVTGMLNSFFRSFTKADREFALQAWIGLDQFMEGFASHARGTGMFNTRYWTGFVADRTHAFSGLSPLTQGQKLSFAMDFMPWMARNQKLAWGELPSRTREMLTRHDFSPVDWEALRKVTPETFRKLAFLTPPAIAKQAGEDLAYKYMTMLHREQGQAVLEGQLQGRTLFVSDQQPGTALGEVGRTVAMVKNFPTQYTIQIIGRQIDLVRMGRYRDASTYFAQMAIVGMLFGAAVMQFKNLAFGRDPEDMSKPGFWLKAFAQSGGMGIYGDFVGSSVNRFGGGIASTVMGPLPSRAGTLLDLTAGNAFQYGQNVLDGTSIKTNVGREFTKALRENTPGALVPFYLRQAYDRLFIDEVQRMLDPDYLRSVQQQKSMLKKRTGQEFYNPPGGPMRAPNFGAAFGQ